METSIKFEDIEKEIAEVIPTVIYKYRNWNDVDHKKIITDRELWFAHPHSLNDPYDIRPPYNFIVDDLDLKALRVKIKDAGRYKYPTITDEELELEVDNKIKLIEQDPIQYFRNNRMDYILDSSKYDNFGVLSLCGTFNNEPMWAYYGNNHSGFTVGFNAIKLVKSLNCSVGIVEYNDSPIDYDIMENNKKSSFPELFRKSTKWEAEDEIRFITLGIGSHRIRKNNFPVESVEEIIFGLNIKDEIRKDIITEASKSLPQIPFYQIAVRQDKFGFDKVIID